MKKITLYLIGIILMINVICVGKIVFATEENVENQEIEGVTQENDNEQFSKTIILDAEVVKASEIQENEMGKFQEISVEILEGEYETEEFQINYYLVSDNRFEKPMLKEGDTVIVELIDDEGGHTMVSIKEIKKINFIIIPFILMLLCYIFIFGKHGIKPIINILIMVIFTYLFFIRRVINNHSITTSSVFTVLFILIFNYGIIMGFSKKTFTAIISTFLSIIISSVITLVFVKLSKISIISDVFIKGINIDFSKFDFEKMTFAVAIFTSLGVCMKVGIFIILKLDELKNKTQDFSMKELYKNGIEIGKECIQNFANELLILYFAVFLIGFFCYSSTGMKFSQIISTDFISFLIMLSISGSIGMLITVPITAILYSVLNRRKTIYRTVSDNKIDGQRSLKL